MIGLTARQREVLVFIEEQIRARGSPPSLPETCDFFGWASKNAAWQILARIERKGFIQIDGGRTRDRHLTRAIRILKPQLAPPPVPATGVIDLGNRCVDCNAHYFGPRCPFGPHAQAVAGGGE